MNLTFNCSDVRKRAQSHVAARRAIVISFDDDLLPTMAWTPPLEQESDMSDAYATDRKRRRGHEACIGVTARFRAQRWRREESALVRLSRFPASSYEPAGAIIGATGPALSFLISGLFARTPASGANGCATGGWSWPPANASFAQPSV